MTGAPAERLQLNASKTELEWFGTRASLQKMSSLDLSQSVDADIVTPTTVVRDLGIHLDNQLTMKKHDQSTDKDMLLSSTPTSPDETHSWS